MSFLLKKKFICIILVSLASSIKNALIRIGAEKKTSVVETEYGDCVVSACGTDSFCALGNNGTCVEVEQTFQCQCKKGFTTSAEDSLYQCCYKQKSSVVAFLLEIFLGFGVGHFYVGNIYFGIVKCVLYCILFISIIIICIRRFRFKGQDIDNSFLLKLFRTVCFLLCGCTYVAWQMIDSVLFSLGGYNDANGMPLY